MGNRVVIVCKSGKEVSQGLYLHWGGTDAPDLIHATPVRQGDPGYALARLVAYACSVIPGTMSVGIIAGPKSLTPKALKDYSHGDAGVLVVDVSTGEVTGHAGYHEGKTLPRANLVNE